MNDNSNHRFDSEDVNQEESFNNIYSWLLVFNSTELTLLASMLAILIANELTLEEQVVVGSFLTTLADSIFLISAQQSLIKSAQDEQKDYLNKLEEMKQKQEEEKEKKRMDEEIQSLKDQVQLLTEFMNNIPIKNKG